MKRRIFKVRTQQNTVDITVTMSQEDEFEVRSTRSRAPSRKKYANTLVDTTFKFNETTKDIQRRIKEIDESARSVEDLDTAMQTLQQVKT